MVFNFFTKTPLIDAILGTNNYTAEDEAEIERRRKVKEDRWRAIDAENEEIRRRDRIQREIEHQRRMDEQRREQQLRDDAYYQGGY